MCFNRQYNAIMEIMEQLPNSSIEMHGEDDGPTLITYDFGLGEDAKLTLTCPEWNREEEREHYNAVIDHLKKLGHDVYE